MGAKNSGLMSEEVFATWYATSMLFAVTGVTFANRETIHEDVRQTLDILFLSISIFIIIWAMMSFFNVFNFVLHRIGMVLVMLATLCGLSYVIYASSQAMI